MPKRTLLVVADGLNLKLGPIIKFCFGPCTIYEKELQKVSV